MSDPAAPAALVGAEFRQIAHRDWRGERAKAVVATRTYETDADDLWDALTNPERLPRWFAPVTGDLRLGGRYQVQGNAGGDILRCEPPHALDLSWEFGGGVTWVTLRVEPEAERARLTLEHISLVKDLDNAHTRQYGPGAVGVGWDLSFLGLGLHFARHGAEFREHDPAWLATEEAKAFMRASAQAWGEEDIRFGQDPETARRMAEATASAYTGG